MSPYRQNAASPSAKRSRWRDVLQTGLICLVATAGTFIVLGFVAALIYALPNAIGTVVGVGVALWIRKLLPD